MGRFHGDAHGVGDTTQTAPVGDAPFATRCRRPEADTRDSSEPPQDQVDNRGPALAHPRSARRAMWAIGNGGTMGRTSRPASTQRPASSLVLWRRG